MPIKLTADLRLLYGYGLWPRMLCRLTFVYSELQDIHSQATAFSFHTVLKNTAMCLYRNIALRFNAAIYKAAGIPAATIYTTLLLSSRSVF